MANVFGPRLGLLFNANIDEYYADNLRVFLQALDQLIMGRVLNATTVVPPSSPSPGDAYLLSAGTPSGAWTGQGGKIAVWNVQVTTSGTNTQVPSWVFFTPNAGWMIWNVALGGLYVYDGTNWDLLTTGTGANFPINTDITALTALAPTAATQAGAALNAVTSGNGGFYAVYVTDGIHVTTLTTNGTLSTGSINCSNILGAVIQAAGGLVSNSITAATPSDPIDVFETGGANIAMLFHGDGASTTQKGLLGFTTYPTQTTVGAAGGASALPATPTGYLQISVSGTVYVLPYYAHA